jgi:hypothetical protein
VAPEERVERGLSLPAQAGALIGREAEVEDLRRLLLAADTRLPTLIGTAGTGKTRLAVELARRAADEFADDVAFVDLSPLSDPTLLGPAIARALGATLDLILHNFGLVAADQGDLSTARRHLEESIRLKRRLLDTHGLALSLAKLGEIAGAQAEFDTASGLRRESLELVRDSGDRPAIVFALERFATLRRTPPGSRVGQ